MEREDYLTQCRNHPCERENPLFFVASSYEEELDRLARVIKQREMMNQRVGILVAKNNLVHSLAKALLERNVMVETAVSHSSKGRGEGQGSTNRFDNTVPKIASYHSAKGLTFDCVLLPRLTEETFHRFDEPARQRLLFVGIARAMGWVYLSTVAGKEMKEIGLLEKAAASNHLVIQRGSANSPGKRSRGHTAGIDEYSVF
jgi:superfamily I DNA/RNA helicase